MNRKITFKSTSGPVDFEASYLTESTLEGTKLTSRVEMRPGRFVNLAERHISANLRRDLEANLGELKDLLEHRATETPS
jgi:hypothetical protein